MDVTPPHKTHELDFDLVATSNFYGKNTLLPLPETFYIFYTSPAQSYQGFPKSIKKMCEDFNIFFQNFYHKL